jgi:hypothetical protein
MQTKPHQLRRQQLVLKHLGYYSGKVDGTWGPASIEAKRMFESEKKFKPSYPNGGLPFAETHDLPAGLEWQFSPTGPLLYAKGMPLDDTKTEVKTDNKTVIPSKPVLKKPQEKVVAPTDDISIDVSNLGAAQ